MAEQISFRLRVDGNNQAARAFTQLKASLDAVASSAARTQSALNRSLSTFTAPSFANVQKAYEGVVRSAKTATAGVVSEEKARAKVIAQGLEEQRRLLVRSLQREEKDRLTARTRELAELRGAIKARVAEQARGEREIAAGIVRERKAVETGVRAQRARELSALQADIIQRNNAEIKARKEAAVELRRFNRQEEAARQEQRARELRQLRADIERRSRIEIEAEKRAAAAREAIRAKSEARSRAIAGAGRSLATNLGASLGQTGGSLSSLGNAVRPALSSLTKLIDPIGQSAGQSFIGGMIRSIVDGIALLPKVILGSLGSLTSGLAEVIKSLGSNLGSAVGGAGGLLAAIFAAPSGGASLLLPVIGSAIGGALQAITQTAGGLTSIAGGLLTGVGEVMSSLLGVVGRTAGKVADVLTSIASTVFSGITSLIGGAAGFIKDSLGGILGGVLGAAGGVLGKIAKTLVSPFTLIVGGLAIKATADIRDRVIDAFALLDDRAAFHLDRTVQHLQRTARDMGVSANELGDLLFDVVSSGFRDVAGSSEILENAAKLAVTGNASVADSGKALITILKAYKLSAEDAAGAAKFLFDVQDRSRATVSDVATSFADLAPVLIAAKVPLQEAGALFSTLTLTGESAAEASTKLRRLILALNAPSPEAAQAFRDVGIQVVKLSEGERATADAMLDRIIASKQLLSESKRGTKEYAEQKRAVDELTSAYDTYTKISGEPLGVTEILTQIKDKADEAGGSMLRLLRELIPRLRAASGGAFLAENLEILIQNIGLLEEDSEKFERAFKESQDKVRVEIKKTVATLQQVGVALFDFGTAITGGRGFETVRNLLDAIRGGVSRATESIKAARPVVLDFAEAVRISLGPLADGSIFETFGRLARSAAESASAAFSGVFNSLASRNDTVGTVFSTVLTGADRAKRAMSEFAGDASLSLNKVLGLLHEISSALIGDRSFSDTFLGSVVEIGKLRFEQLRLSASATLERVKRGAGDALTSTLSSTQSFLSTVLRSMGDAVKSVVGLTNGKGLIHTLLEGVATGGSSIETSIDLAVTELELKMRERFSKLALSLGGSFSEGVFPTAELLPKIDELTSGYLARLDEVVGKSVPIDFGALDGLLVRGVTGAASGAKSALEELFRGGGQDAFGLSDLLPGSRVAKSLLGGAASGAVGGALDPSAIGRDLQEYISEQLGAENPEALKIDDLLDSIRELQRLRLEVLRINEDLDESNDRSIKSGEEKKALLEQELRAVEEALLIESQRADAFLIAAEVQGGLAREQGRAAAAAQAEFRLQHEVLQQISGEFEKIVRFPARQKRLLEDVSGVLSTGQKAELKEILELYKEIEKKQLSGKELVDAEAEAIKKLAAALGTAADKASVYAAARAITAPTRPLTGTGNLGQSVPTGAPPVNFPGTVVGPTNSFSDPFTISLGGATNRTLERIESNTRGFSAGFSKPNGTFARLSGGSDFEQIIASLFREFGVARQGIGSFVGDQQLARGKGYIPLDSLPLDAIKSVFDQVQAGGEDIRLSYAVLADAARSLLQIRQTGEAPGPRVGEIQGFQIQNGRATGVTPEALQSDAVQRQLELLAGRAQIAELLNETGLHTRFLADIARILDQRAEAAEDAANAGGLDGAGGRSSRGRSISSDVGRLQSDLRRAQKPVDRLQPGVDRAQSRVDFLTARRETARADFGEDSIQFKATTSQLGLAQDDLRRRTETLTDAQAAASKKVSDLARKAEESGVADAFRDIAAGAKKLKEVFPEFTDGKSDGEIVGKLKDAPGGAKDFFDAESGSLFKQLLDEVLGNKDEQSKQDTQSQTDPLNTKADGLEKQEEPSDQSKAKPQGKDGRGGEDVSDAAERAGEATEELSSANEAVQQLAASVIAMAEAASLTGQTVQNELGEDGARKSINEVRDVLVDQIVPTLEQFGDTVSDFAAATTTALEDLNTSVLDHDVKIAGLESRVTALGG